MNMDHLINEYYENGGNLRGDIIVNLPMYCEIRGLLFDLFWVWGMIFVSPSERFTCNHYAKQAQSWKSNCIIPDFVEIWNIVFKNKMVALVNKYYVNRDTLRVHKTPFKLLPQ